MDIQLITTHNDTGLEDIGAENIINLDIIQEVGSTIQETQISMMDDIMNIMMNLQTFDMLFFIILVDITQTKNISQTIVSLKRPIQNTVEVVPISPKMDTVSSMGNLSHGDQQLMDYGEMPILPQKVLGGI